MKNKKDYPIKELINEQRTIIKLEDNELYRVKFNYKYKITNLIRKGLKLIEVNNIELEEIIDDAIFDSLEEAKLYIDVVEKPSQPAYNNNKIKTLNDRVHYKMFLKNLSSDKEIKPEWFRNMTKNESNIVNGFGISGTRKYDFKNFINFINTINKVYLAGNFKEVATYDIHQLDSNITLQEELKNLYGERNEIVIKEIERTNNYVEFLKKLLK